MIPLQHQLSIERKGDKLSFFFSDIEEEGEAQSYLKDIEEASRDDDNVSLNLTKILFFHMLVFFSELELGFVSFFPVRLNTLHFFI